MKRTAVIRLGLTSAMALALTGCNRRPQEAQRCVDSYGRVVQDYFCESRTAGGGSGVGFYPYRWYYGGTGYYPGDLAGGGRDTLTPGAEPLRSSSAGFAGSRAVSGSGVVRGGFGGTAEGAGAGE